MGWWEGVDVHGGGGADAIGLIYVYLDDFHCIFFARCVTKKLAVKKHAPACGWSVAAKAVRHFAND